MDGWREIKLLAFDVDGVLTDGTIYYGPGGDAMKGFSARDGMGISLARAAGLKTAIITGRRSPMVERRAEDLHIDYVMQNTSDKLAAFSQLCQDLGPDAALRRPTAARRCARRPPLYRPMPAATARCASGSNIF